MAGAEVNSEVKRAAGLHEASAESRRTKDQGALDAKTQRTLGQLLRAHFGGLVDEPLPDRITRLCEELERKQRTPTPQTE